MKQYDLLNIEDLRNVGNYGCYLLCLLYQIDNKEADEAVIRYWYKELLNQGLITTNCYIKDPEKILKLLTNKVYKISVTQDFRKADIMIAKFAKGTFTHFVIMNNKNEILFDPLEVLQLKTNWTIDSYRLFDRSL